VPAQESNGSSFDEKMARPEGKELTACAQQVRAVSERLDNLAWNLTVRDLGRSLARFAQHLAEDAQRLDMLALVTPTMETLPDDKKQEIADRFSQREAEGK